MLTRPHLPALDGVRGLAILFVIAFHARVAFSSTAEIPYLGFRILGLGWSGVDLFFVLSGFLITGILLDSREAPHYFRTFYIRRVLRIFPLYFAYLFLILVVARLAFLAFAHSDPWQSTNPWWYFTYLLNWKPDHGFNDTVLGHLWSLAIEEQFYLVWPAVVWLVPRPRLKWVCLSLIAAGVLARVYLSRAGFDPEAIYRMTPGRMDTLALGAFVAVGVRDFRPRLDRWYRVLAVAAAIGFLAVWAASPNPVWSDVAMRTAGASLLGMLYAVFVFRAATVSSGALHRLLTTRLLRQCGKYSYAMYVLHSAPFHLTSEAVRQLPPHLWPLKYLYFPALAAVAYLAARVSWRLVESPFLRLKDRLAAPPSSFRHEFLLAQSAISKETESLAG